MMAGYTAPAETAREGQGGPAGHDCPECGQAFATAHPRQLFCAPSHRLAWKARSFKRGVQLLPFAVVARLTRGGTRGDETTGRRALADMDMLITRWRDEDAANGRMSMPAFLALRYRLGFDRP